MSERLSYSEVIKWLSPHIHGEALKSNGIVVVDFLLNDLIKLESLTGGLLDPAMGRINSEEVDFSFLEGFVSGFSLGVESEFEGLKIPTPPGPLHFLGPPVMTSLETQILPFLDFAKSVETGDDWKLEIDLVEISLREHVRRKNRETPE